MRQTSISQLPSDMDKFSVVNLNYDYPIDSTKYHLNVAFVLNREVELPRKMVVR
jgi:hypothetical protein